MKRKLTSILLMSALLVGGASTFVSCKDYDGDQAAELNAKVGSLKEIVDQQKELLEQLVHKELKETREPPATKEPKV